jgi:hypothetical protein
MADTNERKIETIDTTTGTGNAVQIILPVSMDIFIKCLDKTIPIGLAKIPASSALYIFDYGLKQALSDGGAADATVRDSKGKRVKAKSGEKADDAGYKLRPVADVAADKENGVMAKLAKIFDGTVTGRSGISKTPESRALEGALATFYAGLPVVTNSKAETMARKGRVGLRAFVAEAFAAAKKVSVAVAEKDFAKKIDANTDKVFESKIKASYESLLAVYSESSNDGSDLDLDMD